MEDIIDYGEDDYLGYQADAAEVYYKLIITYNNMAKDGTI